MTIFPKVSWVLCSNKYNEHLRLAIESCLNQTYKDFELIIICNGDDSIEIKNLLISLYSYDIRVRIFDTNIKHLIFSLNLGLHYARGEYIARMDGDDISIPNRLEVQVNYLDSHKFIHVLGSNFEVIDSKGRFISGSNLPLESSVIKRWLYFSNPICHPTVMMRKETICSIGGYSGGFHAEDYELWVRLAINRNINFANLSTKLIRYRNIGVSGARRSKQAYISMFVIQIRAFLGGAGFLWLISAAISCYKLLVRAKL